MNVYFYVYGNKFKKIYDFRVSLFVSVRIYDISILDMIFYNWYWLVFICKILRLFLYKSDVVMDGNF